MKNTLLEIFARDLDLLKTEIAAYKDENDLWIVRGEILNSAGNLCLHLLGNLNHFVGAILGNSGFVRNRDAEFSLKDVPQQQLLEEIDYTKKVVLDTIAAMKESDFALDYPVEKHGKIVKMEFMLLHLLTHFNYHVGQINYHRRIIAAQTFDLAD
ncbi:MAG: DUF1572 family protein [Saprospiraceae bacterium]|nr:DUF1572 family protein [Saprospiraceae bacterium]